ncbi:unnamed protein product [Paramecium sonneborni]|uniref:Uncharacterized protein n=1 Tax=Paramecium sonneborni TaxID=65129 RepID=A0A8S1RUE0_9CILI|nr:unnamed protein product [Paramecium sonneborni]
MNLVIADFKKKIQIENDVYLDIPQILLIICKKIKGYVKRKSQTLKLNEKIWKTLKLDQLPKMLINTQQSSKIYHISLILQIFKEKTLRCFKDCNFSQQQIEEFKPKVLLVALCKKKWSRDAGQN